METVPKTTSRFHLEEFDKDKDILVYDLATIPAGIHVEKVVEIMKKHNFLLFDSTTGGKSPYIIKDGKEQYGNKEDN